MISFDDWKKLDLRVGKIIDVQDHPNADKLYIIKVDVGEEKTIVSGIKDNYKKEYLIGKEIIVICNLQPAKFRGIESHGMLLAVSDKGNIILLKPEKKVKPGSKVE